MTPRDQPNANVLSRRALLRGAAGFGITAAAAALLPACGSGSKPGVGAPLETTTIKLNRNPFSCLATEAVAVDFLLQEGFRDVQFLDLDVREQFAKLAAGVFDIHMFPAPLAAARIDAGDPVVVLGGVHVGCWQVFGTGAITSILDLRGKSIVTGGPAAPDHVLFAATLANVGIDMRSEVRVVNLSPADAVPAFAAGQVDGFLALPPFSTQLRARKIGHVILDAMVDRPWSQYYCCMAAVNRDFMANNPVATKSVLCALLKAADVIAVDPERGGRAMVERGYTNQENYDSIVDDLRMMPFDVWREYDPADTLNFFSLRLREAGLIASTPQQVISRGADFHFLRELKRDALPGGNGLVGRRTVPPLVCEIRNAKEA